MTIGTLPTKKIKKPLWSNTTTPLSHKSVYIYIYTYMHIHDQLSTMFCAATPLYHSTIPLIQAWLFFQVLRILRPSTLFSTKRFDQGFRAILREVASWDPTSMGSVSTLLIPFSPLSSNHMREEVL